MEPIDERCCELLACRARGGGASRWTDAEAQQAHTRRRRRASRAEDRHAVQAEVLHAAHEYATVRMLVDLIIPKDERSGSATDAGVPEFMDFMMVDQPARQTAMRGGLAWLDRECVSRFDKTFLGLHARRADRRARRHRLAAEGASRSCRTASPSSTASAT